jgi:hypothetical protein
VRGSVTRLNKRIGCGFILREDGFLSHFDLSSLGGIDIRAPSIGSAVEYEEHFANERRRAARVTVMSNPRSKSASVDEK